MLNYILWFGFRNYLLQRNSLYLLTDLALDSAEHAKAVTSRLPIPWEAALTIVQVPKEALFMYLFVLTKMV